MCLSVSNSLTLLTVLVVCTLYTKCSNLQDTRQGGVLNITFQEQCILGCPFQNQTDDNFYEVGCANDCRIEQCAQGCLLWKKALETSCRTVCNGTQELLPQKKLYCVIGCNDGLSRYFSQLRITLGTPPAPALVADSLNATSLRLEWAGPGVDLPEVAATHIRYLVQWRYEELAEAWQYCRNQTWAEQQDTVFVDQLQPYTKYRFRVAILLSSSHGGDPIVSKPSVVISTLASGVPSSPPIITRVVAVDSSRVSISWEPGPFPNGPVLSYVLRITPEPPDERHHSLLKVKDIPASGTTDFYMFENLASSRNYTISVAMRNGEGEGPAVTVSVTTQPNQTVAFKQEPVLILGANHSVIQQSADLFEDPITLYSTKENIRGIAIHVSKELLFISDSAGYVLRTSLTKKGSIPTPILTPNINFLPLDLSVDWLNEHLYILGQITHLGENMMWQIARCGLDGKGLTIAVAGFQTRPRHFEVDPYNGYLFWVDSGGLWRHDLADISNGVRHEARRIQLLSNSTLGAFTVDHTNFRLLVPDHSKNTIYSVTLDGRDKIDLRNNTQQPMFQNIVSLSIANGLFYWTNGKEVITEEYHELSNSYFQIVYPDLSEQAVTTIVMRLSAAQPIPVPVNPPTALQAILAADKAKITWQTPHLLGGQGKGAWQNWSYELQIHDVVRNKTERQRVNVTSCTIPNLREDTVYNFKAAAYTTSGKGPWSSEFYGKTLKVPKDGRYPTILWSSAEGLLKSDVTGDSVNTLVYKSGLKDYFITDITWYKQKLYLVLNTTYVNWYDLEKHETGRLTEIESVESIAVDWIGRKLYWSNPNNQLITRGNLNGSQQEPLPILTLAKELNIDSIHAYLYWSTGHAVECSRLNGADRRTYYTAQLFSGKQVMGLTLDISMQMVYWIVRSSEGSTLWSASTAEMLDRNSPIIYKTSLLRQPGVLGPLCFFSDRLLWLQDSQTAVIGDRDGQNAAIIGSVSLNGLSVVAVVDNDLHGFPDKDVIEEINVIPEPVKQSSIRINGTWKSFNITWDPISNVNYGDVFYEVKINDHLLVDPSIITTVPSIQYAHETIPYSKLEVNIRAFTYWGSAPQSKSLLHSPPSVPTPPRSQRVFITYQRYPLEEDQIVAILRWDEPLYPNGVIRGYIINCYTKNEDYETKILDDVVLPSNTFEFTAKDLKPKETYYFEVQAYTEIGRSETKKPILARTDMETPVPELIYSSDDTVYIRDLDREESTTITKSNSKIIDITYMYHEKKIFWLNDLQEIFVSNFNGTNKMKLVTLNGTGISLTVDWVQRCLYWVQYDVVTRSSAIYLFDLNRDEKPILRILNLPTQIFKLKVSPFTSSLYWTELDVDGTVNLMKCATDGSNLQTFFNYSAFNSEEFFCNCSLHATSVKEIFALDHTTSLRPKLIYIVPSTRHVIATDRYGCNCQVISNDFVTKTSFNSVSSLHDTVYLSNKELMYLRTKIEENDFSILSKSENILNFGPHTQPFPPGHCLTPQQVPLSVKLFNRTADSVVLQMPEPKRFDDCFDYSMPSVLYSVYYAPFYNEGQFPEPEINVSQIITYDKLFTINKLKPYSQYGFSVSLTNYYSKYFKEQSLVNGTTVIYRTAAGAPSKPQNVTAVILNPTLAEVQWYPPEEFNDETVWYEIHWLTERTIAGVRQKGEQAVDEEIESNSTYKRKTIKLHKLFPNQTYLVWVRAYSQNSETYSDSDPVRIETYPEPNNLTLNYVTAYSLNVAWKPSNEIQSFEIQYAKQDSATWIALSNDTRTFKDGYVIYHISDLEPRTLYKFRLFLYYPKFTEVPYVWPNEAMFVTLADKPSPPGTPVIQHFRGDVYQVTWEPGKDNGAPIKLYRLEGRSDGVRRSKMLNDAKSNKKRREINYADQVSNVTYLKRVRRQSVENHLRLFSNTPYVEEDEVEWEEYYNGSDNYWLISELAPGQRYWFRVSALNAYGWSAPSEESVMFEPSARVAQQSHQLYIIIAICMPLSVVLIVGFLYLFKCKTKETKSGTIHAMPVTMLGPDVELATLRDMPRTRGGAGGHFGHSTNVLYTTSVPDGVADICDDATALPHIRRDQITLTKFLGSGAFGEVFEGKARGLDGAVGETKVAVKTLRKGASQQERAEFLREAQLMAHFKHAHILRLLGVCRDNDPHFIIMELMQAGDLLSYLRLSRPLLHTSGALTLMDLLSMCVDVARGCRYLEEMHFVHRDLACRNCLVSSADPVARVVKIGDFGLARDVYKNDYYRKEGEGLLPVRWMAPESLVDGVFTSQSDVWAFGVLTWEIMTLGQQPYPARTNLEVLHYVRNGGRLHRPSNCPDELHQLMLKCWSYNPETRPTFKYCLDVLEKLKADSTASPLTIAHTGNYISTVRHDGHSSNSQEENLVPSQNSNTVQNNQIPGEVPKYLELIYEPEDIIPTALDGYEVPRSSIRSMTSTTSARTNSSNVSDTDSENKRCRTFSTTSTVSGNSMQGHLPVCGMLPTSGSSVCNGTLKNNDVTSLEKLLPKNGVKPVPAKEIKCTYSNIAQVQLPLLVTEATDTDRTVQKH